VGAAIPFFREQKQILVSYFCLYSFNCFSSSIFLYCGFYLDLYFVYFVSVE
jgi:hypothetical protein